MKDFLEQLTFKECLHLLFAHNNDSLVCQIYTYRSFART